MRKLPRALRWYLWATYCACAALVAAQIVPFMSAAAGRHGPPLALQDVVLFLLLAYVGEQATLYVGGSVALSVATPVHIGLILLFPAPFPVLVTLLSALASQVVTAHLPPYKRGFNVCHPTLVVGLSGAVVSLFAAPTAILHPGHVVAAIPLLALLIGAYYALDAGLLLGVLALLDGQAPWRIWWRTRRRTVLPELAGEAVGILAAVAWRYDHVLLALVVLPVVALRAAFQAIARAEQAQQAAEAAQRAAEEAQQGAEAARGRAEEAVRVRDEFLTAASHDLRTPLTGVVGYADVMQMRLDRSGADPSLRTQLDALRRAAARMVATVEEITDAAQLQIGHRLSLQVEEVDVSEMVRSVAALAEAAAPPGGPPVVVETGRRVVVEGDRARLERVMQNIIGNAIKYSPRGTPVHVTARADEQGALIVVRDSGVGIPAAELPHIFTHFYRASTAIGIKGTGVGLAGAKAIVEQHGGRISAESAVGRGTTITVSLPRTLPASARSAYLWAPADKSVNGNGRGTVG